METPSSTRRVTRSQTLASANKNNNNIPISKKIEESEKGVTITRQRNGKQQQQQQQQQQDRSALIDITNDSPIVGLAMGSLETPSSAAAMSKRSRVCGKSKCVGTPGSGEALLRGQVKTLLQKVEEEAELSKLSLENGPFHHLQGIVHSPMALLAPTPANTPQVLNLSASRNSQVDGLASVTASPVEDKFVISQMVNEIFEGKKQEGVETEKDFVTRSLLLDFSEKSEGCCDSSDCSSVVTSIGGIGSEDSSKEKISPTDDDDASVWSMQVNASSSIRDDAEEEDEEEGLEEVLEEECYDEYDYGEEEEEEVDELCRGMSRMNVDGGGRRMAKFAGKHTRFVYNSDCAIEGQEECGVVDEFASTPKRKHLFYDEDSDED